MKNRYYKIKIISFALLFIILSTSIYAIVNNYYLKKISGLNNWSPRDSMGEVVFDGRMWLMGGFSPERNNEVWSSTNGIDFEKHQNALWSERNLMGTVNFKNKIFVMGGTNGTEYYNDCYSSSDGENWESLGTAPWLGRAAFACVVHNNKIFIYGGIAANGKAFNDVWSSVDGKKWVLESFNAPWSKRGMHSFVSFKGKLWLISGGVYDTKYVFNVKENYKDIWSSTDGINWQRVLIETPFTARRFSNAVVYDGNIFLIGGFHLDKRLFRDSKVGILKEKVGMTNINLQEDQLISRKLCNLNDVWYTSDGIHWKNLVGSQSFSPRHESSALVFNNRLYIMGGFGVELYSDTYSISYFYE